MVYVWKCNSIVSFAVLPEPQQEYISSSLTSPSPMFNNSSKSDLDTMMYTNPRYPDNNTYYPNNWNTTTPYYNNFYYSSTNNNQQYPGMPPVVLHPHLYSTVNQNQIHLHLHGSTEKLETLSLPPSCAEIGGTQPASADVAQSMQEDGPIEECDRAAQAQNVTDPASVWRPY